MGSNLNCYLHHKFMFLTLELVITTKYLNSFFLLLHVFPDKLGKRVGTIVQT